MKLIVLAVLSAFAFGATASAAEHPKEYYDPDVQRLMHVEAFAFGPTGFKREPSAGERAFAAIVKKKDAIRCMVQVFDHGTAEGKCYALVALREFSGELYVRTASTFRLDEMPVIRTIDGEAIKPVPTQDILDAIHQGLYQKYFRQYEDEM